MTEIRSGMKLSDCTFATLYTGISGRVMPLRSVDENQLGILKHQGDDKAGERAVILTPNAPLDQILSGDYLVIPWGVKPNTWSPLGTPAGTGPCIWLNTPTDPQQLCWDGTKFVGDTLELELIEGEWCLSGEVSYCFGTDNFCCQLFPYGYGFLRASGPEALFKIVHLDSKEDDKGRLSHYNISIEIIDQKYIYVQE